MRKICPILGCDNTPNKDYWVEIGIDGFEGMVQMNVCYECYQKISAGGSYSI